MIAVGAMHIAGWVHRKLSPTAIMVDSSMARIKLADLESAKDIINNTNTAAHPGRMVSQ